MNIVKSSEDFVKNLFKDKLSSSYSYHNLTHTEKVIDGLQILIKEENIPPENAENLLVAGWFHDIGFIDTYEQHEEASARYAKSFLESKNVPADKIEKICQLILATKKYHEPQDILESIMRDADGTHLGCDNFLECTENLRLEIKTVLNKKISRLNWAKINLEFLSRHQYYTNYAKKHWQPIKEKNIEITKQQIQQLEQEKLDKEALEKDKALLNKKKLEKLESPERGIETMFRVTLNNHTQLSQIADSKANILLSVNSIIISVALSVLVPKLDSPSNSHLIIPTFILIISSVSCIILSIMSTRPKINSGTFTRNEIKERKINLLFFGNFHQMPVDEYVWAMREMMNDRKYLYDAMIKDLYYLGVVLNRKYKILRTTYTVFTIGIIVSVIAFVVAFRTARF